LEFVRITTQELGIDLKFLLSHYGNAFWHAPSGRRLEVIRNLRNALADPEPTATGECIDLGEIRTFEDFETKYRTLAAVLGHGAKTPPPGEIEFLRRMVEWEPRRPPGGISGQDYFFLTALVSILAPHRVIEIGTLTGFSAAIIAAAIHRQHGKTGTIAVETIDASTQCIVQETRPVGFEIPELIPELASTVRVHPGRKSDFVRELSAAGKFGLGFIDADHRHPWPLLDVLRLAPALQTGGWIVLHDIQLATYGRERREAGQPLEGDTPYGAECLFARWPFRKISSAHIGAIELPRRQSTLIPFALSLMERPYEVPGKAAKRVRRELYKSFVELT
jgi:predicted O-methyltransferase YrrM